MLNPTPDKKAKGETICVIEKTDGGILGRWCDSSSKAHELARDYVAEGRENVAIVFTDTKKVQSVNGTLDSFREMLDRDLGQWEQITDSSE